MLVSPVQILMYMGADAAMILTCLVGLVTPNPWAGGEGPQPAISFVPLR